MTNGSNIDITEDLDGFQYKNQRLQFFAHAEGYVNVSKKYKLCKEIIKLQEAGKIGNVIYDEAQLKGG